MLFFLYRQGNISRQEAVSMIPPLLLDVRPGQKVCNQPVKINRHKILVSSLGSWFNRWKKFSHCQQLLNKYVNLKQHTCILLVFITRI